MDEALRIILPAYFLAYFAVAILWRSIAVWRRTGINPYVIGRSDSAYDYIGVIFKLVFGLLAAAILCFRYLHGSTFTRCRSHGWITRLLGGPG